MDTSILTTIKKLLGLTEDYKVFDQDLILLINNAFFSLNQLGVGPIDVFSIDDDQDTWTFFLGVDTNFEAIKTYIYLKARLVFDPPETSFLLSAIEKQIAELEWRLNVKAETP